MSSFIRKAMWPAALIVGMFVLIGALGTATAPAAQAAIGDVCSVDGPTVIEVGDTEDYTAIIEGDPLATSQQSFDVDVNLDDEVGDSDITSVEGTTVPDTDHTNVTASDAASCTAEDFGSVFEADLYDCVSEGVDPCADADWTLPLTSVGINATDVINVAVAEWVATNGDCDAVADAVDTYLTDHSVALVNRTNIVADVLTVCEELDTGASDVMVTIDVTCDRAGNFTLSFAPEGDNYDAGSIEVTCYGPPANATLTATPASVESRPAIGNVSHSLLVLSVTTSSGGLAAPGYEVDWTSSACTIEARDESEYVGSAGDAALFAAFKSSVPATAAAIEAHASGASHSPSDKASNTFLYDTNPGAAVVLDSRAVAILHCEGADPGTVTVTADIEKSGPDVTATATVTVVGPPAFITMVAEPTSLVCGEKAQILITVTDALNQNVSDHTRIELITNYGGVIGGTGSSLGFPGINPVNPLSSSAAETFSGVATAFLLTSTNHIGSYEVVVAAGGSNLGGYEVKWSFGGDDGTYSGSTGQFSTAVITNQVTVTCTEGAAPDVTAPDTGTGTISPPNTGDAGLASRSAGTASLFVIAGAVAFVLAGFASFRFARR